VIFATVGTHEDPFDRLVTELDRLVECGEITEPVHIQRGYSAPPRRCTHDAMMPFAAVQEKMRAARVVITHGGPATIMQALALGQVPVVVPRQSAFGEHVDDHQVRFATRIADRVIVVLDIATLGATLRDHARRVAGMGSGAGGPERARAFALRLDALCSSLVGR
jgi:UDP-N-acetylglucosamine transferase subunit ALG13